MIVVDTSVWIDFFRGCNVALCEHLTALLDADQVVIPAPVRVEILSGARKVELSRLRRVMAALPSLMPSESTWGLIERWLDGAVSKGQRFGVGDLLVGAIATEAGAQIWSLDRDFSRMARLGWVRLHEPK